MMISLLNACNSDNFQNAYKTSKNPELDMVYYKIVKSEMKEFGNSIGIVDRTIDTVSINTNKYGRDYVNSDKTIRWNKAIFPSSKYIDGDSLLLYMNENSKKYWELKSKFKSGWIELTVPIFSSDKRKVIIEVSYFQGDDFGTTSCYFLELLNGEYKITKKELISIS